MLENQVCFNEWSIGFPQGNKSSAQRNPASQPASQRREQHDQYFFGGRGRSKEIGTRSFDGDIRSTLFAPLLAGRNSLAPGCFASASDMQIVVQSVPPMVRRLGHIEHTNRFNRLRDQPMLRC